MHFLIVDPNHLLCRFLTTYLGSKGHTVSGLTDPSKAMEWLETNPCDAIITEVEMSKIGGIALIAVVREKFPDLPIIMFTKLGYDERAMQSSRKAGANGYISKGMGPSEIYSAIIRVLSHVPTQLPEPAAA